MTTLRVAKAEALRIAEAYHAEDHGLTITTPSPASPVITFSDKWAGHKRHTFLHRDRGLFELRLSKSKTSTIIIGGDVAPHLRPFLELRGPSEDADDAWRLHNVEVWVDEGTHLVEWEAWEYTATSLDGVIKEFDRVMKIVCKQI